MTGDPENPGVNLRGPLGAVIVAGGLGRRFGGGRPKQFLPLRGRPLICWSVEVFRSLPATGAIVLVVPSGWEAEATALLGNESACLPVRVVPGGEQRQDSVAAGLAALPEEMRWVAVHDAARPGLPLTTLAQAWEAALHKGNAVCALPCFDTLVEAEEGTVIGDLDRARVFRIQTPQIFPVQILKHALDEARRHNWLGTDDAGLVRRVGGQISLCQGSERSLKVTRSEDLATLSALLTEDDSRD